MKPLRITLLLVSIVAVSPALAQSPIREGRWEVTTQMQMANMPMQLPPMKTTRCVTAEEVKDPASAVPRGAPGDNSCKVSDQKVEGNKISWKMACTGQQKMTGSGEIVVNGDTYDGVAKMTMDMGEMTMKYSAKRLGDCTK